MATNAVSLSMRSLLPQTLGSKLTCSSRSALISSFGRTNVSFSLQPRSISLKISCAVDKEAISQRVKKVIVEQLGLKIEEVVGNASFVEDLGADSLDTVELVMALEEEFDIEIADETAERITTVQSAIDAIAGMVE